MFDEAFWVAVAFFVLMGIFAYYKLPGRLTQMLDKRAEDIRRELEEARALREEAQALLASYQRRQRDAASEAEEIIEHANEEARRLTAAAEAEIAEILERRTLLAVEKIGQAEAQVVQEVRELSVDVSIAAATRVIGDQMDETRANEFIDKSVSELQEKLTLI